MISLCSLCAFWLEMDQKSRREMSREKMEVILKLVVKHFFIKKEVTSSLVMDFLFHGLNSLVWNTNNEKTIHTVSKQMGKLLQDDLDSTILKAIEEEPKEERATDVKNLPAPIVSVDKDVFVFVDDAMLLMEKAVDLEPLPDERDPQNRMEVSFTLFIRLHISLDFFSRNDDFFLIIFFM